jgi:exocyst complex component 4
MTDDTPGNPEADTFSYIQLLIEALNKMARLDIAVDTIEQRLPVELFKVVEKCNNEVAQRHPSVLRAYTNRKNANSNGATGSDEIRTGLLNDLLWTLYARFEAIAESHRVAHDVIVGIVRREGIRDASSTPLTRGFKELWKLYKSEIRSLLHDYLATRGDSSYRGGQGKASSGNAFSRGPRKTKAMFKLEDMDLKSTELTMEREDLEVILKSSVPGLVSDAKRPEDVSADTSSTLDGSATGHKLLVEPSVFNMGILLPPSLNFLNRLKEVVPPGTDIVMSTLTSFLDDFLVNVFHPLLDETLVEMSARTFIEVDAFQQEPQWSQYSKKPIFKGTAKFFTIITAFCRMLDNLPHDQAFSHLILSQIETYAEKCAGWYKALVSRVQPTESGRRLKGPAFFADAESLRDVVASLMAEASGEPDKVAELTGKETTLLLSELEREPLDQADCIRDGKSIAGLCLLYTSMKWLATKVAQLRYISDRATDSSRHEPGAGAARHNRRWTLLASTEPRTEGLPVYLPLNAETAQAFDAIITSFQSLSTTVLRTLHFIPRVQILQALSRTIGTSYTLDTLLNEPDPAILTLNEALIQTDTQLSTYLPASVHPFLRTGLAVLMDTHLLNLAARNITSLNDNGAKLMQLNILVLQQNLKNIEDRAELRYAALWFDLFLAGSEEIVARAKREGKGFGVEGGEERPQGKAFGYEGVKKLVELCYAERLGSERREVGVGAKRKMDGELLEISEALY